MDIAVDDGLPLFDSALLGGAMRFLLHDRSGDLLIPITHYRSGFKS